MELSYIILLLFFVISFIGVVIFVVFSVDSFIEGDNILGCLFAFFAILLMISLIFSHNPAKSLQENQIVDDYDNIQNNEYILIDEDGNKFDVIIKER